MARSTLGRDLDTVVRTQSANIAADNGPYITSSAINENLQFTLPDAADNPGLWFEFTHVGPRVTTLLDNDGFRFDFNTSYRSVVVEVVDGKWALGADAQSVMQPARIWDAGTMQFRQAIDLQDVIDSLHKQIRSLIEVIRLNGIEVNAESEEFHEHSEIG